MSAGACVVIVPPQVGAGLDRDEAVAAVRPGRVRPAPVKFGRAAQDAGRRRARSGRPPLPARFRRRVRTGRPSSSSTRPVTMIRSPRLARVALVSSARLTATASSPTQAPPARGVPRASSAGARDGALVTVRAVLRMEVRRIDVVTGRPGSVAPRSAVSSAPVERGGVLEVVRDAQVPTGRVARGVGCDSGWTTVSVNSPVGAARLEHTEICHHRRDRVAERGAEGRASRRMCAASAGASRTRRGRRWRSRGHRRHRGAGPSDSRQSPITVLFRFPCRSIWAAPRKPTSMRPACSQ